MDWDAVAGDSARSHDVVVPLVHGEFGEDGALQRRLESWGVPYVFSTPDALALTLDKEACLCPLSAAGFPVPTHRRITRRDWAEDRAEALVRLSTLVPALAPAESDGDRLVAVKPVSGGSSFGVAVVSAGGDQLSGAVDAAFASDPGDALVEEFLTGTEFCRRARRSRRPTGRVPDGSGEAGRTQQIVRHRRRSTSTAQV